MESRTSAPLLGSGCKAWFMDEQKENILLYFLAVLCNAQWSKRDTLEMNGCEAVKVNTTSFTPVYFKYSIEKQSHKGSFIV